VRAVKFFVGVQFARPVQLPHLTKLIEIREAPEAVRIGFDAIGLGNADLNVLKVEVCPTSNE
jgi:hypothetical protein